MLHYLAVLAMNMAVFTVIGIIYMPFHKRWLKKHLKELGHPDFQDEEPDDKEPGDMKKQSDEKKLPSDYRNVD